jgi:hypothetical protein
MGPAPCTTLTLRTPTCVWGLEQNLSKQPQERSQDSTPSATGKSPKPAQAGVTPQKLPEDDKALPVRAIYFSQIIKFPGMSGAASMLVVDKSDSVSFGALKCDSIFLYRGEFIVDGMYFIPKTAGAILCYKF